MRDRKGHVAVFIIHTFDLWQIHVKAHADLSRKDQVLCRKGRLRRNRYLNECCRDNYICSRHHEGVHAVFIRFNNHIVRSVIVAERVDHIALCRKDIECYDFVFKRNCRIWNHRTILDAIRHSHIVLCTQECFPVSIHAYCKRGLITEEVLCISMPSKSVCENSRDVILNGNTDLTSGDLVKYQDVDAVICQIYIFLYSIGRKMIVFDRDFAGNRKCSAFHIYTGTCRSITLISHIAGNNHTFVGITIQSKVSVFQIDTAASRTGIGSVIAHITILKCDFARKDIHTASGIMTFIV